MKKLLIAIISFVSLTIQAKTTWLVEVTNKDSEVKQYKPDNGEYSIVLEDSPYKCGLQPAKLDRTNYNITYIWRRLDCYNIVDNSSINLSITCSYSSNAKTTPSYNQSVLFLSDANPKLFNRLLISCRHK